MSKAVKADHEFSVDKYADLLAKAQGERSQTDFAKDCGLSVAYICKHLNRRIDKAPIPSTLKKIAACAANGVTYADLLDAAGYNPVQYTSISNRYDPVRNHEFEKLAVAAITSRLSETDIKWYINGKPEKNFDMVIELNGNKISRWYFNFISNPAFQLASLPELKNNFFERIYGYYGRFVLSSADTYSKYSFVTASADVFDLIKSRIPKILAAYVSVILIDMTSISVIKEEEIPSALAGMEEKSGLPLL